MIAMTAEHYVALAVSAIGTIGIIVAAILPGQIKTWRETKTNRRENREDHSRVVVSVNSLHGAVETLKGIVETQGKQLETLTTLVVTSAADLKAHAQWEEGQKYATPDHIEQLIVAITETSGSDN